MSLDPNNVQTAPLAAENAPAPKPVVPLKQVEWTPGLSKTAWENARKERDSSINGYLRAAIDAHRTSGTPWASDMRTSPLDREGVVKSGYSASRVHPVDGGEPTGHFALDIAPVGGGKANVVAMLPGTVLYVGYFSQAAGNSIMVLNDNGEIDFYAHMQVGSNLHIHPGKRVRQGQIIGEMGMTGKATGPHVHITTRKLSPESLQQSAQAQVQVIDFTGLTVQPLDVKRVTDPAIDWVKYENAPPQLAGSTYAVNERVPTPPTEILRAGNPLPKLEDFFPPSVVADVKPSTAPLETAPVETAPLSSNIGPQAKGPAAVSKDRPVTPF